MDMLLEIDTFFKVYIFIFISFVQLSNVHVLSNNMSTPYIYIFVNRWISIEAKKASKSKEKTAKN